MKRKNKFFFQNKRFLALQKVELSFLFSLSEKHSSLTAYTSLSRRCNRCFLTGSTKSFIRKFGLSRQAFREKALNGFLLGVKKSSF
jgi:ribosomal protein S14